MVSRRRVLNHLARKALLGLAVLSVLVMLYQAWRQQAPEG
jgi:hypothetical protein